MGLVQSAEWGADGISGSAHMRKLGMDIPGDAGRASAAQREGNRGAAGAPAPTRPAKVAGTQLNLARGREGLACRERCPSVGRKVQDHHSNLGGRRAVIASVAER